MFRIRKRPTFLLWIYLVCAPSINEFTNVAHRCFSGLIQNAEDHLIKTVKDLVEHYVMGKNTLIVIAMPMTGQSLELISAYL
jgi:hypothetical protein